MVCPPPWWCLVQGSCSNTLSAFAPEGQKRQLGFLVFLYLVVHNLSQWLFLVPCGYFVFCCWKRCLSMCSQGPRAGSQPPISPSISQCPPAVLPPLLICSWGRAESSMGGRGAREPALTPALVSWGMWAKPFTSQDQGLPREERTRSPSQGSHAGEHRQAPRNCSEPSPSSCGSGGEPALQDSCQGQT